MSATPLLTDLASYGITLETNGGTLRYYAVECPLTPEWRMRIKAHKGELVECLTKNAVNTIADPAGPCPICGSGQWWQLPGNPWYCHACESDMPLAATTLTLSCHEV